MMNSIFLDTLNGKETHRPPVWFMRQAGRSLASYQKMKEKYSFKEMMENPELAAKVTLLPIHDLGVDAAILFSDILVIPEALGMKLEFQGKGPVFENPLKGISNPYKSLKADGTKLNHVYKAIDEIKRTKPENTPLIGFCGGPLTTFCFMVDGISQNHNFPEAMALLYKNKAEAIRIFEAIGEMSIEYALKQVEHGIDAFQLFETHAGLIPEDLYFEVVMPVAERIMKAVKQTGTPVIYLPKGLAYGVTRITPDQCDFISVDWQMNINQARKLIHPEIGIQGNIDPRAILSTPETIKPIVDKLLEFGKTEPKWIFNLGHGILANTPFDNIKYVVDYVKEVNWR
ncbi:MAG: uroporphyrinogen decarboxylase [Bacteroidales bacterium]|jgi:uroporphyrinogen decarboxylase|nr:uroporphyrinogen decarboxylase [Bacteroidales bacterium]